MWNNLISLQKSELNKKEKLKNVLLQLHDLDQCDSCVLGVDFIGASVGC